MIDISKKLNNTELLLQRILNHTDQVTQQPLVEKYNTKYFLVILDRNKINAVQKLYPAKTNGLDIIEFTRFFLNFIDHNHHDTLYLAMGIIDLFKDMTMHSKTAKLKSEQVTDFICSKVLQQRGVQQQINARLLPTHNTIQPNLLIKDIEINPPIIYGDSGDSMLKLCRQDIVTDRIKHASLIKHAIYNQNSNRLLALDSLANFVNLYDSNCRLLRSIMPNISKFKRDIVILGISYSLRQERLGAVLKDHTLVFWDLKDDFTYQKSFSTTRFCNDIQNSIWCLDHHNVWITGDNTGTLYLWNLDNEQPRRVINLKLKSKINDLCEIKYLNLIAIVQENILDDTNKQIQMYSNIVLYSEQRNMIVMQIDMSEIRSGVNTLQFSKNYQVLLASGFQTSINVFQIHPLYFDATLKGRLIGHQSPVTTFTCIDNTPMVISADDKNNVKIWDIRNFKCMQTLDFSGKAIITKILGMMNVNKIALLGSRVTLVKFQCGTRFQDVAILSLQLEKTTDQLIIFTKKDLRIYDINNGKIKHIYTGLLNPNEQIFSGKYISTQKKFLIGNQKGDIKVYSYQRGKYLYQCSKVHTNQIISINYDYMNKLYISAGWDSRICIFKQQNGKFECIKSIQENFNKGEINILEISVFHNVLAMGNFSDKLLYFWDYEFLKIIGCIEMVSHPTALCFLNGYAIMIFSDNIGFMYGFEFEFKDQSLNFKEIFRFQIAKQMQNTGDYIKNIIAHPHNNSIKLVVGLTNGFVLQFTLDSLNLKPQPFAMKKNNSNIYRQVNQYFPEEINKKTLKNYVMKDQTMSSRFLKPILSYRTHKQGLVSLITMDREKSYIITAGSDRRIKIWRNSELCCDVNLSMILPFKWNLSEDRVHKYQSKIIMAIKIIENIFTNYKDEISISESKHLRLDHFFQYLLNCEQKSSNYNTQPTTFQTYFNKEDLYYEKVKKYYFHKIAGPSLKQMEIRKRIRQLQKQTDRRHLQDQLEKRKMIELTTRRADKIEQRQQISRFFQLNGLQTIPTDKQRQLDKTLSPFYKKLNNFLNPKQPTDETMNSSQFIQRNMNHRVKTQMKSSRVKIRNTISFQSYWKEKQNSKLKTQEDEHRDFFISQPQLILKANISQPKLTNNKFQSVLTQLNQKVLKSKCTSRMRRTRAK